MRQSLFQKVKLQGMDYNKDKSTSQQIKEDLLRKGAWYNYPHYKDQAAGPFANTEDILKVHYTHCLDILRQQIMCTADTGVFGQWWVKHIGPFVDFNTKHKCKNFEDIRVWAEMHQMTEGEVRVEFRDGDTVLDSIP
ncbi:hypothetical protein KCU67_g4852, partial [Aureobasidium melanogenum]